MKNMNKEAMDDMQVEQVSGGTLPKSADAEQLQKIMKTKPRTGIMLTDDQLDQVSGGTLPRSATMERQREEKSRPRNKTFLTNAQMDQVSGRNLPGSAATNDGALQDEDSGTGKLPFPLW